VEFFQAGGFPMLFVLVFGLVAIGSALRFAVSPAPGRAGPIAAYGAAVLCVSVAGTAFDLATVARYVAARQPTGDELLTVLVIGAGESMSPLVLGSSLVAVAALATAVGLRRRGT
jgi:hypothetical protein